MGVKLDSKGQRARYLNQQHTYEYTIQVYLKGCRL